MKTEEEIRELVERYEESLEDAKEERDVEACIRYEHYLQALHYVLEDLR